MAMASTQAFKRRCILQHIGCDVQTDLELELIERLKKKQVQQQQALQELQEAMALTSRSPLPPLTTPWAKSNLPQTSSAAIMCMLVASVSHFYAVSCKPVVRMVREAEHQLSHISFRLACTELLHFKLFR